MPSISVPLTRSPASSDTIRISFTTRGTGPVLVLLVPGLCVPSSMYDNLSAVLCATGEFTTAAIDNRGIGASDAPPASLLRSPAYSARELAADAWAVADHVQASRRGALRAHVGLVGHSMGGMVVQAMLQQQPRRTRFVALLSTHAGGAWNLLPTLGVVRSAARVAWSGFDRDVHAAANLSLHFTQRFLDDWVGTDPFYPPEHAPPALQPSGAADDRCQLSPTRFSEPASATLPRSSDAEPSTTLRFRRAAVAAAAAVTAGSPKKQKIQTDSMPQPSSPLPKFGPAVSFFESKVLEFARDAQIFFGLSVSNLPEALRHPRHTLLEALGQRQRRRGRPQRSRRFDIYHARYTGQDDDDDYEDGGGDIDKGRKRDLDMPPSASAPAMLSSTELRGQSTEALAQEKGGDKVDGANAPPQGKARPDPAATDVLFGHLAVVRSHSMPRGFARKVRACSALFKLVVTGRHDQVVTPSATRALAATVAANTLVELDAAHFVTDEASAEVTTHVMYGLRKAFFVGQSRRCECEWCLPAAEESNDSVGQESSCRMC